jgi:hypothetical protein
LRATFVKVEAMRRKGNCFGTLKYHPPLSEIPAFKKFKCGVYPANQQGGPWVRFQDQEGEYLVSIKEHKVSRVLRYKGRVFAGELSGGQEA